MAGPFRSLRKRLKLGKRPAELRQQFPEIRDEDAAAMARFSPFTMTGPERQWALINAMRYLDAGRIAGDVVECGVWRGGNVMIAKHVSRASPVARHFWLFDTFAGMSAPTDEDVAHDGSDARPTFAATARDGHTDWCLSTLDEVRGNFAAAGLLDERVTFVQGKVEETLRDPANLPEKIALLRLDTDFYESTKVELEVLFPLLVKGGVMIVDDYGHWRGARQAVDEYFADRPVLLNRIDYTARLLVN